MYLSIFSMVVLLIREANLLSFFSEKVVTLYTSAILYSSILFIFADTCFHVSSYVDIFGHPSNNWSMPSSAMRNDAIMLPTLSHTSRDRDTK